MMRLSFISLLPIIILSGACSKKVYNFDLYHHYTGDIKALLSSSFNTFSRKHSNVRIQRIFKNWQDIEKLVDRSGDTASTKFRDAFIIAHDRIGQLASAGLIQDISGYMNGIRDRFSPSSLEAVRFRGKYYGYPLSSECITLFYNDRDIKRPPKTIGELLALRGRFLNPAADRYLLLFPIHIPYFTLPWVKAFGGRFFDDRGRAKVNYPGNADAFLRTKKLLCEDLRIPFMEENLIIERFGDGRVQIIMTGPWMLSGFIKGKVRFKVAPMPELRPGKRIGTFIGVQCIVLSSVLTGPQKAQFHELFNHFYDTGFSRGLSLLTKFVSPVLKDRKNPAIVRDPIIRAFNDQIRDGFPMNNTPEMAKIWKAFNENNMKALLSGNRREIRILLDRLQAAVDAN